MPKMSKYERVIRDELFEVEERLGPLTRQRVRWNQSRSRLPVAE